MKFLVTKEVDLVGRTTVGDLRVLMNIPHDFIATNKDDHIFKESRLIDPLDPFIGSGIIFRKPRMLSITVHFFGKIKKTKILEGTTIGQFKNTMKDKFGIPEDSVVNQTLDLLHDDDFVWPKVSIKFSKPKMITITAYFNEECKKFEIMQGITVGQFMKENESIMNLPKKFQIILNVGRIGRNGRNSVVKKNSNELLNDKDKLEFNEPNKIRIEIWVYQKGKDTPLNHKIILIPAGTTIKEFVDKYKDVLNLPEKGKIKIYGGHEKFIIRAESSDEAHIEKDESYIIKHREVIEFIKLD